MKERSLAHTELIFVVSEATTLGLMLHRHCEYNVKIEVDPNPGLTNQNHWPRLSVPALNQTREYHILAGLILLI